MHSSYGESEPFVGKPAQEARRRCCPGHGTEGFDEKNLQKSCQDELTGRALRAGFFSYELHEGGQPFLAADMHEFREE